MIYNPNDTRYSTGPYFPLMGELSSGVRGNWKIVTDDSISEVDVMPIVEQFGMALIQKFNAPGAAGVFANLATPITRRVWLVVCKTERMLAESAWRLCPGDIRAKDIAFYVTLLEYHRVFEFELRNLIRQECNR